MFVDPEKGIDTIGTTKFATDVRMAERLTVQEPGGRLHSVESEGSS
jgi:hypothetical protein